MKQLVKKLLAKFGLRVTRTGQHNRFQAMEEVLRFLRDKEFIPDLVVDAGANRGQWTCIASRIFPEATFHLIEPQVACREALSTLTKAHRRFRIYSVAVSGPGIKEVTLLSVDPGGNTGAYVDCLNPKSNQGVVVESATLDSLIVPELASHDRLLLKLDLEGHELAALRGAEELLNFTEVIVVETHLYDPEAMGRSTFGGISGYLDQQGFVLFDIASLSSRQRDGRLRQADLVFVRMASSLMEDDAWS